MRPARGEAGMTVDRVVPLDSENGVDAEHSPGRGPDFWDGRQVRREVRFVVVGNPVAAWLHS